VDVSTAFQSIAKLQVVAQIVNLRSVRKLTNLRYLLNLKLET